MLRHRNTLSIKHMLMSDSETESDDDINNFSMVVPRKRNGKQPMINTENLRCMEKREGEGSFSPVEDVPKHLKSKGHADQDALLELANKYQSFMKKVPIPTNREPYGVIVSWQFLAKTLALLYGQRLHYLTYMLCKQWDESRCGSEDEEKPMDTILKWRSAQDTLWKVEEIHRLCTSPFHLAKLWLNDPEYHVFVHEVIPSR